MSYTPTNWQTGDVITAEKLNKLENGVRDAGGGYDFIVTLTGDSLSADGISFEEMSQRDLSALKVGYKAGFENSEAGYEFSDAIYKSTSNFEGITSLHFIFYLLNGGSQNFIIASDGTAFCGINYLYTYADGHYTFTEDMSSGGTD